MQWESFKRFFVHDYRILHIHCMWDLLLDFIIVNAQRLSYCLGIIVQWSVGGPFLLIFFLKLWHLFLLRNISQFLLLVQWRKYIFKILRFTCTGPFRRYRAHFEGIITKKKYPEVWLCACGSVRYDESLSVHKIISYAWNLTTAFLYVAI